MRLRGWLARWDRRNQAIFDGEISDDTRDQWRWERDVDGNGGERLIAGRGWNTGSVVLDQVGVHSRLFITKRWTVKRSWPWDQVAFLTWGAARGACTLAVCRYGNPYVRFIDWGHLDARVCRAMLDDCTSFVEEHGARVYNTTDTTPEMWWSSRPEAQRGFER